MNDIANMPSTSALIVNCMRIIRNAQNHREEMKREIAHRQGSLSTNGAGAGDRLVFVLL